MGLINVNIIKFASRGNTNSGYSVVFTVGTTKFTLGMMDDGNLHLYYTETEEIIRTWESYEPYTPTGLALTIISDTAITLNWTNIDTAGDGVSVERSPDGTIYDEIATVALGVSTYSDKSLTLGEVYYYRIRAYANDTPLLAPNGLILSLVSGGIKIDWTDTNSATAQTEIWGQSDGDAYTLLYTMNEGVITKTETINPVDLRYCKIRASRGGVYSEFTTEVSIAMLYPEKILNGSFTDTSTWLMGGGVGLKGWVISGGKANFNAVTTSYGRNIYQGYILWLAKKYRIKFNISNIVTSGDMVIHDGVNFNFGSPFDWYMVVANGDYAFYLNCVNAGIIFQIYAQRTTGTYSLDNLSVKEIIKP